MKMKERFSNKNTATKNGVQTTEVFEDGEWTLLPEELAEAVVLPGAIEIKWVTLSLLFCGSNCS